MLSLNALFSYGPNHAWRRWRWINWGAFSATVLWSIASIGVSFYTAHIASFGRMYGSLGAVAVVLLWFYVSALAILAGAEIDATLAARVERRQQGGLKADLRQRERSASPG